MGIGKFGRSDRIRTCDPQAPSLVRYQTALRSDTPEGRIYLSLLTRKRKGGVAGIGIILHQGSGDAWKPLTESDSVI